MMRGGVPPGCRVRCWTSRHLASGAARAEDHSGVTGGSGFAREVVVSLDEGPAQGRPCGPSWRLVRKLYASPFVVNPDHEDGVAAMVRGTPEVSSPPPHRLLIAKWGSTSGRARRRDQQLRLGPTSYLSGDSVTRFESNFYSNPF